MKRIILLFPAILWGYFIIAQTALDALRFSYFDLEGTARTVGVGGGIGALGGDFSVISSNPAGLAIFRTSELTLTPGFIFNNTAADLEGAASGPFNVAETKFNLNNAGLVLNTRPLHPKWKSLNFAFGINRLADFKQTFFYSGKTKGSYVDRFLERAFDQNGNGLHPDDLDAFEAGPAYSTGAIYTLDTIGFDYINDFDYHFALTGENPDIQKRQTVRRKGGISELVFSMAGNYNEKLMLGATIGVPIVNFEVNKTYMEEDPNDEIISFVDMTFEERVKTRGAGINLKLGAIYRVSQALRVGAAIHTPTAYSLTDTFHTVLEYSYDFGGIVERARERSPEGAFRYGLSTPWRFIGNVGVIIQKSGFITAEIEYVNYRNASFNLTSNSDNPADAAYERIVNNEIDEMFENVINVKVGGEYALNRFRVRAGVGFYGSPHAVGDYSSTAYSFGLGYRLRVVFFDLAYRYLQNDAEYIPYYLNNNKSLQQTVNYSFQRSNILLTVGFKF